MKEGQPNEIRLADYEPPGYTTKETTLHFDLQDGSTEVTSHLLVERLDPNASSLTLDGEELELLEVKLDGVVLEGNEYSVDDENLEIHGLGERHEVEIRTRIKPEENTALEGLYRSSQMYCTQCEAQGFRKITYYQDRPDVQSRFTTTIVADGDTYPTLLSNGNKVAEESREDGRLSVTWEDPFPKPSYLFALVAGNLAVIEDRYITGSGREITLRIYSEPHNIGQCEYAMDALKRSMAWDEHTYGREYDLDIFMIVAVEDFNMGAMENKGLNIFNTSCVLASPDTATDAAYQRVEAVVAHEYFHNWSGNRVTCRDWFQLSLKEGFTVFRDAQFSADMNSEPVKRVEDVTFLRSIQFAEDAGPLAHAVRPDSYIEISNFYTTTIYEKGAEIVGMYHTLLGPEKFRAGTDLYFDRHDGSAATTDDFASCMSEVSGIDLTQFKRWYEQAGTPELTVRESYHDGVLKLTVEQQCPPTPRQAEKMPFHLPVLIGFADHVSGVEVHTDAAVEERAAGWLLQIREAVTNVEFRGLEERPVVSFLRSFSAPVKVHHARPDEELAHLVKHDADGFVRWDAMQTLWVKHFRGDGVTVDLVSLVGDLLDQALDSTDAEERLLLGTMLAVPDENYLFEELDEFEVDSVCQAREEMLDLLAGTHAEAWRRLMELYSTDEPYSPEARAIARRTLKNTGFSYYTRTLEGEQLSSLVESRYRMADNLTDRRAALAIVTRHPGLDPNLRSRVLTDFYDAWQDEALVIDLWFNIQAQSPLTSVDDLRQLEAHPAFSTSNPNRARSVYAAFGMLNHQVLHDRSGSGYVYLADAIGRLDGSNPQLAARLATPLTRWQRYDRERQALMRSELEKLAAAESISKDLYEIVTKSLRD